MVAELLGWFLHINLIVVTCEACATLLCSHTLSVGMNQETLIALA